MDNRARWAREAIPWNSTIPFSEISIFHSVIFSVLSPYDFKILK